MGKARRTQTQSEHGQTKGGQRKRKRRVYILVPNMFYKRFLYDLSTIWIGDNIKRPILNAMTLPPSETFTSEDWKAVQEHTGTKDLPAGLRPDANDGAPEHAEPKPEDDDIDIQYKWIDDHVFLERVLTGTLATPELAIAKGLKFLSGIALETHASSNANPELPDHIEWDITADILVYKPSEGLTLTLQMQVPIQFASPVSPIPTIQMPQALVEAKYGSLKLDATLAIDNAEFQAHYTFYKKGGTSVSAYIDYTVPFPSGQESKSPNFIMGIGGTFP